MAHEPLGAGVRGTRSSLRSWAVRGGALAGGPHASPGLSLTLPKQLPRSGKEKTDTDDAEPALFLVLTLGLIGTWQVFDQIYLLTQGNPAETTLTPAFLSYQISFSDQQWGQGAAIAFILFAIIVVLTIVQRLIISERRADGAA